MIVALFDRFTKSEVLILRKSFLEKCKHESNHSFETIQITVQSTSFLAKGISNRGKNSLGGMVIVVLGFFAKKIHLDWRRNLTSSLFPPTSIDFGGVSKEPGRRIWFGGLARALHAPLYLSVEDFYTRAATFVTNDA